MLQNCPVKLTGCILADLCDCSAAELRMQALAAAHWHAVQAAESAAGGAGLQPCSGIHCSTIALLPRKCPQLVDSSFMALLRQRIASLPTVSRLIPRPLLLCPALLWMNCCLSH